LFFGFIGKYLFSGSSDSDIRIWELPTDPTLPLRAKEKKLDGHLEDINALVASKDLLCSASRFVFFFHLFFYLFIYLFIYYHYFCKF